MLKHLPEMQETEVQSLGREDSPGEGNATHSSTLAWKIPWTEEAGRLQSVGGKDLDTPEQLSTQAGVCMCVYKLLLDWKRSVFIPIPKKGNAKECSNYCTIALISHASTIIFSST